MAQSGDPLDLWDLYFALTPQNCTSEVATLALSHLDPHLVPSVSTGEHKLEPHKTYADRALPCVSILAYVGTACDTRPSFATEVIPRLAEAMDGICLWINHLLHFGLAYPTSPLDNVKQAYYTHCQLLFDMVETDKRLSNATLSSPTFIDLLLRCWTVTDKESEVFLKIDLAEAAPPCPILNLMVLTTENSQGVQILVHQIQSRPRGFSVRFAGALIDRARQLVQREVPPTRSIGLMDGILRIVEKLLSIEPNLRLSFIRVNYLTELSLATNFASIEASKTSHPIKFMQGTVGCVMKLSLLIMQETPRSVHNWRDLVKGDYYALLVRSLAHVAPQDKSTESLYLHLLKIFGVYTIYPCMVKLFFTARIPEASMKSLDVDPRFKAKWEMFQRGLQERGHVYGIMPKGFSICDNLNVS